MLRVYTYSNCDTCRKAVAWLKQHQVAHEVIPIRETPPTAEEVRRMAAFYDGELRKLFNVSGQDYREAGLKESLPSMELKQAVTLLTTNGNLVKRPFAIGGAVGLVGFSAETWAAKLLA